MDTLQSGARLEAEVLNAAWWVRHYRRAHQAKLRAAAIARLGEAVRAALDRGSAERVLYAVAVGLYERGDPRFN